MQQASRIAIIGLLALMQLFAPLVHAHLGGESVLGAVHVPGLEFLGHAKDHSAQASHGCGEYSDVIVVLAPCHKSEQAIATPSPDAALLAAFIFAATPPSGPPAFPPPRLLAIPQAPWLKPSPRAPPSLG